jgi:acyl dehydratase
LLECPVRPDQALLYRQLGDDNPLHTDAAAARAAGFEAPILHGLCTYGIVGLAVVTTLCDADPGRLVALDLDFRAPVFPGEPLRLEAWREPGGARLRLAAPARGGLVTARGRCALASAARSSGRR